MIDHIGFSVSDYARARAFYEKALAPRAPYQVSPTPALPA
jgi:catechol 2,3-dioxygenase-like lactoylglutathione lyase family enzyme